MTLDELRKANERRQAEWPGVEDGEKPGLLFRSNEMCGEAGEVANVVKKLVREQMGWGGSRSTKEALADELGDLLICADLLAAAAGIDLDEAVAGKFNKTSEAMGLETKLPTEPSDDAGGAS